MTQDPETAGQPPEVDPEDNTGQLPPPENAAERVLEFVAWFGDGVVAGGGESPWEDAPPLYARDLEAIAVAVQKDQH